MNEFRSGDFPVLHIDAATISGNVLWQWRMEAQQEAISAQIEPGEVDWFLQALSKNYFNQRNTIVINF